MVCTDKLRPHALGGNASYQAKCKGWGSVGVMSIAGWHELGESIAKLIAQEPPFVQIMIGLGGTFSALMFIEGLRASLFPRREMPKIIVKEISAPPPPPPPPLKQASPSRTYNLQTAKPPRVAKRQAVAAVKPFRTPRPKIRRISTSKHEVLPAPYNTANLPQVASFDG